MKVFLIKDEEGKYLRHQDFLPTGTATFTQHIHEAMLYPEFCEEWLKRSITSWAKGENLNVTLAEVNLEIIKEYSMKDLENG